MLAVVLGIPLALMLMKVILPILAGMLIAVVVVGLAAFKLSEKSRSKSEPVDFEKLHGFKIHTGKFVRPADFTWVRLLQPNEELVCINRFMARRGSDRGWITASNDSALQRGRFSTGFPYLGEPVAIINTSDQEFDVTVHLNPGGERMEAQLRVVSSLREQFRILSTGYRSRWNLDVALRSHRQSSCLGMQASDPLRLPKAL